MKRERKVAIFNELLGTDRGDNFFVSEDTEAFGRGQRAGADYWPRVVAGIQGEYERDRYPCNPFHNSDPRWGEFNAGFNAARATPQMGDSK